MNPVTLVQALVDATGKSTLAVATEMHRASFQGTLHKFLSGNVRQPTRHTAEVIARYFRISVDAIYDPRTAATEARRLGVVVNPYRVSGEPAGGGVTAREPSPPGWPAFSSALRQRLQQLDAEQLEHVEHLINAHLDALGTPSA